MEDLLKLADTAMYHAKKTGLTDYYLLSDELTEKLHKKRAITDYLKKVDITKELVLKYQAIFDFKTDEIIGLEVLIHWENEDLGRVEPMDFIPIAEEIDIIKDITRHTFVTGLNQIREWNTNYNKDLVISLNVSNICIHNRIFFENLKYMLDSFKIKPQWLSIELTETSLNISPEYMKELILSAHKLGVATYIDDFGTGLTSLRNLTSFEVDTLKIDNSLIASLTKDKKSEDMVKSIILFAHGIGLKVIAEAVETKEQYDILKKYNCDSFQGFYKTKALAKNEFENKYLK